MAIIQSYPINYNVNDDDLLLGVTNIAPSGNPIYQTKSFRVSDVRGSGGGGGSITIGIANGLSLQGSVLSLGLASSSANGALSSDNWTTFNNKQNALSGTGFIKASGSIISYDNNAYTPTSRTLTINGTTYDLSSNRSWTVGANLTLTTNGTSGPSTLVENVLNIPQYSTTGSLEFNSTDLTVWNNGKGNIATNTSFGDGALTANTSGVNNTCYGNNAGYFTTTGRDNTFIGRQAGQNNTTGMQNTSLGFGAGGNITTGQQNTSLGSQSGGSITTGSANLFVGRGAGFALTANSSNNVLIGPNAGPTTNAEQSNQLYIANASGVPLIGGNFVNKTVTIDGTITASGGFFNSDIRLKDVISRNGDVIFFKWKDGRDDKTHIGYSAQEVMATMPDAVSKGENGVLSVNYIEVLVAKIAELENRIKQLEK